MKQLYPNSHNSVVPYVIPLNFYVQIEIRIDSTPIFHEKSINGRLQIFCPREKGQIQDGVQDGGQFQTLNCYNFLSFWPMMIILVSNHMFLGARNPMNPFMDFNKEYISGNSRWRPSWLLIHNISYNFLNF